jgi:hypothetical protein
MSASMRAMLDGLDEAFDKKSWHGPNLRAAIRGATSGGDRHNIWELTLHAAYWKYAARRKILREKRGSFVLAGSNFFERPEGGLAATGSKAAGPAAAWKRDIAILEAEHRKLRDTVAQLPARALTPVVRHLLRGAAAHDLYHAGQIRLPRRMCF